MNEETKIIQMMELIGPEVETKVTGPEVEIEITAERINEMAPVTR